MTVEVDRKFVPLMVRVWAAAPTVAEVGERMVMVGAGLFTVKFTEFDAPPPGAGLVTTTASVPAVAWSPVLKGIVNCVELTKVVLAMATLFQLTVAPLEKLTPLTVRVWVDPVTVIVDGTRLVIAGIVTVEGKTPMTCPTGSTVTG